MVWNYVELKWNGKTCWNYCELNPSCKGIELKLQLNECELNDSTLSPQFQCPETQRCRKDFLIGGAHFFKKLICSTGHIEWTENLGGARAPNGPLVPTPMRHSI